MCVCDIIMCGLFGQLTLPNLRIFRTLTIIDERGDRKLLVGNSKHSLFRAL